MAKQQDLSLNPSKLSGLCGRLKCCLRYELPNAKGVQHGGCGSEGGCDNPVGLRLRRRLRVGELRLGRLRLLRAIDPVMQTAHRDHRPAIPPASDPKSPRARRPIRACSPRASRSSYGAAGRRARSRPAC